MVVLTIARGPVVLAFGLGGVLLNVAYTAPPLRLKKRGLGELDVLLVWGPLMIAGTYYSATGRLPWQVWPASIPYGLLCTAVLMGKHIDKIPWDRKAGMKTLPVLLGEARARVLTEALMVGFYVAVVACVIVGALPWPALACLGALPLLPARSGRCAALAPSDRRAGSRCGRCGSRRSCSHTRAARGAAGRRPRGRRDLLARARLAALSGTARTRRGAALTRVRGS